MCIGFQVNYPLSHHILMETEFSVGILEQLSNTKFHETFQWEPRCFMRTDGQT